MRPRHARAHEELVLDLYRAEQDVTCRVRTLEPLLCADLIGHVFGDVTRRARTSPSAWHASAGERVARELLGVAAQEASMKRNQFGAALVSTLLAACGSGQSPHDCMRAMAVDTSREEFESMFVRSEAVLLFEAVQQVLELDDILPSLRARLTAELR